MSTNWFHDSKLGLLLISMPDCEGLGYESNVLVTPSYYCNLRSQNMIVRRTR